MDKPFITSVYQCAQTEMDAFNLAVAQHGESSETDPEKIKILNDRDSLIQAIQNFSDARNAVFGNYDDKMQAQMNGWMKGYFDEQRGFHYKRNRNRVTELQRTKSRKNNQTNCKKQWTQTNTPK
tara:strand:+ start:5832 stop:6203 length:372 start_codon:yes stop_codon:yes gene_type:complete